MYRVLAADDMLVTTVRQAETLPAPALRSRPLAVELVAAVRPAQWVKNVLVGAAPLAAGEITDPDVLAATGVAFVAFCMAAGGVYLCNDLFDVEADRAHPVKCQRPIASGAVAVPVAVALAVVLLAGSLLVSALLSTAGLVAVMATYIVLNLAYSAALKHQRVIDMAIVSSGFLLRAIAGGASAEITLSRWFLIVAAFGSLFMVAGKRYSELVLLGEDAARTRRSLAGYSASYLRFVWSIAAAVAIGAYCLWAFEVGEGQDGVPWAQISVAPFVIALLRYALDVDSGRAGAPEDIVLHDRVLQLVGVAWLVIFTLGAFGD
jgi:decaprenyl-phosphate phosphoribosyltransferase